MRKLITVFILIISFSCKGKKRVVPAGIIEPKKMELVFWDYVRADVYTRDFLKKPYLNTDTLKNLELQQKIFNFYKISREEFYDSYEYYLAHPELMGVVIDSMIAKHTRVKPVRPLRPIKHIRPLQDHE